MRQYVTKIFYFVHFGTIKELLKLMATYVPFVEARADVVNKVFRRIKNQRTVSSVDLPFSTATAVSITTTEYDGVVCVCIYGAVDFIICFR
jgi:hypothetical protein